MQQPLKDRTASKVFCLLMIHAGVRKIYKVETKMEECCLYNYIFRKKINRVFPKQDDVLVCCSQVCMSFSLLVL